jgi:hypothetical protein
LVLRAAPVTATLADWAVSRAGKEALLTVLHDFAGVGDDVTSELRIDAIGLAAMHRTVGESPDAATPEWGTVAAAIEAAGVIAVSRTFGVQQPPLPVLDWTLDDFRTRAILPLLVAAVELLEASESYGRSVLQLDIGYVANAVQLIADGTARPVPSLTLRGQLSLPRAQGDIETLAARWVDDIGRGAGFEPLR